MNKKTTAKVHGTKIFIFCAMTLLSFCLAACGGGDDNDEVQPDTGGGTDNGIIDPNISGTDGTHAWVNLGLTSGTMWATMNIDQDPSGWVPDELGGYFAWGESKPKWTFTQENYAWFQRVPVTVSNGDGTETIIGYENVYTKYEGIDLSPIRGVIKLKPDDDAATVLWGEGWCLPSYDQVEELCQKCTWEWVTLGDVAGYKVTGPSGKYILMPAAGKIVGDAVQGRGTEGWYWSNSRINVVQSGSYCLHFSHDGAHPSEVKTKIGEEARYNGLCVRPVRSM